RERRPSVVRMRLVEVPAGPLRERDVHVRSVLRDPQPRLIGADLARDEGWGRPTRSVVRGLGEHDLVLVHPDCIDDTGRGNRQRRVVLPGDVRATDAADLHLWSERGASIRGCPDDHRYRWTRVAGFRAGEVVVHHVDVRRTGIGGDGRLPGVAGAHDALTGPPWGWSGNDRAELRFADVYRPGVGGAPAPFGFRLFLRRRRGRGLSTGRRVVGPQIPQGKEDRQRNEKDDAAQHYRLAHVLVSCSCRTKTFGR